MGSTKFEVVSTDKKRHIPKTKLCLPGRKLCPGAGTLYPVEKEVSLRDRKLCPGEQLSSCLK
jgi:hypothetical protein